MGEAGVCALVKLKWRGRCVTRTRKFWYMVGADMDMAGTKQWCWARGHLALMTAVLWGTPRARSAKIRRVTQLTGWP